jgi:aldose sugar dehydrogenase
LIKKLRLKILVILFLSLSLVYFWQVKNRPADTAFAVATLNDRYQVEEVATGLGVIWGLAFISNDQLLFTERQGTVGVLNVQNQTLHHVSGVAEVKEGGQGGLLDVAVPPGYKKQGWIYFTYSKEVKGQGATTLARARLKGVRLVDWQDLLVTTSSAKTAHHYGSRIAFDQSGHVYFTVGDRGGRPNAQDLTNHAGSVLRLTVEGAVPSDNPFVAKSGVLPEIWSYGHRNPQGIVFDEVRQKVWAIEHGPRGGDEINEVLPGRNYGWPVISYGQEYWGLWR